VDRCILQLIDLISIVIVIYRSETLHF